MGIEPTFPGLNPGVLSQLNYGNPRHSRWTLNAEHRMRFGPKAARSCAFGKTDGQVAPHERGIRMPGIEPGPPGLSSGGSLTVSNHPFIWSDNLINFGPSKLG